MQQRQLRLGDILDDYCPRERRLTNHVVVAMIGDDVRQTRCSTCDADHDYKHARVPRQRRKSEPAALYAAVAAAAPKKVVHEMPVGQDHEELAEQIDQDSGHDGLEADAPVEAPINVAGSRDEEPVDDVSIEDADEDAPSQPVEDGPVHRPLIRAQLPRTEGQPPPTRPAPDFTIRQPGGRPGRFRPRQQRGAGPGQTFQGNRSNGNMGNTRGGGPPREYGGRPPLMSHLPKRQGPGRKRSK
jgi:hypothetical protein